MGLTKKQKDERAAIAAGTHERVDDGFGNSYLRPLEAQPKKFVCVHCGEPAVEIVGNQLTPGDLDPYKHANRVVNCPKAYGPLGVKDVREV